MGLLDGLFGGGFQQTEAGGVSDFGGGGMRGLLGGTVNGLSAAAPWLAFAMAPRDKAAETLLAASQLQTKQEENQASRNALKMALISSGIPPAQAEALSRGGGDAAKIALQARDSQEQSALHKRYFGGADALSGSGASLGGAPKPQASVSGVDLTPPPELAPVFAQKEQEFALPSGHLARTAKLESNFNPSAQNPRSSAGGLFQFLDGTADQYGLTDKRDPLASTDAAARLARDNAGVLKSALGRDPTGAELYLAHQQGAGGASALLSNPDAPAVRALASVYQQQGVKNPMNRALQAVTLNGGRPNMTAGEFASLWTSKYDRLGGGTQVAEADLPAQGSVTANSGFYIPGTDPAQRVDGAGQPVKVAQANTGTANDASPPQSATRDRLLKQREMFENALATPRGGPQFVKGIEAKIARIDKELERLDKTPTSVQEFEYGRRNPEFFERQDARARAGAIRVGEAATEREQVADRLGLTGEDRKSYILNGKVPTANEKAPTEAQSNAALYASRMKAADGVISTPAATAASQSAKDQIASRVPVIGNYAVSEDFQKLEQAQRDFINAVLRRESGAVISEPEFDNARKQYFPQPGDSPAVVKQKAQNRRLAIEGITAAAGNPAMQRVESQSQSGKGPAPGKVEDGYRFMGGNPADPKSWQKVQ